MTAVAIFVKTPGLSPIKTRLAATIGVSLAEHWHQLAAQAVAEIAQAASIGPVYWAVAEAEGVDYPLWQGLPRRLQPQGALGTRMAHIHNGLIQSHGQAILLGADTPQIVPTDLVQASDWLSKTSPRQVIGPATDGGFWGYGSNRVIEPNRWERIAYSQADTLKTFQAQFDGVGSWLSLATHTDVDEQHDMSEAHRALSALSKPSPTQRALVKWLENNAPAIGHISA